MKKTLFVLLISTLLCTNGFSQQAIWGGSEIVSPEIHPNNSVTFRLHAPNAKEVKLTGEWTQGSIFMNKDDKGVWSHTTAPLSSNLYGYSFWVDSLRTIDPSNVYINRDVATVFNIFIIGGGNGDYYKVNKVPHGSVTRRWYYSPGNEMERRITIYTPPGYESGKEKYPVLYLLHGMGGDEEAWMALGRTSQILDNLIAQGKAKPMIVVMTNGNVAQEAAPGESSLGFYKPGGRLPHTSDGKMEETFIDVISFVENNYRVIKDKSGRAVAGLSMGGFHAMGISRYYPNTFDYVGLFSHATRPREEGSPVYQNIDEALAAQKKNGYKLYWIAIGKTDFLYKAVEDYRAKLDSMDFKYTYVESEGGHTWSNWRDYMIQFVPLLFK
ncbi:esterase [Prevotella sp. 10(H)]|uniref:esterase n=1 Tax=Prevotella sp. 10(H) TaxID=1158294 RepID=UPI0004A71F38|nr:esterase [Prevotella sp. 10(H)]